jgi:hypothetical protein
MVENVPPSVIRVYAGKHISGCQLYCDIRLRWQPLDSRHLVARGNAGDAPADDVRLVRFSIGAEGSLATFR